MSGAAGRPAEVLRERGGVRVSTSQQFQAKGFYVAGFLSLILTVLKLTEMKQWSWWRVLLPLWLLIGHNAMYLLVGFLCLFAVRYGEEDHPAKVQGDHISLSGSFATVCSDFYGQLVEMGRARRKVLLVLALLRKDRNGGFVWGPRPGCAICVLG